VCSPAEKKTTKNPTAGSPENGAPGFEGDSGNQDGPSSASSRLFVQNHRGFTVLFVSSS